MDRPKWLMAKLFGRIGGAARRRSGRVGTALVSSEISHDLGSFVKIDVIEKTRDRRRSVNAQ